MDTNSLLTACASQCSSNSWSVARSNFQKLLADESSLRKVNPATFLQSMEASLQAVVTAVSKQNSEFPADVASCASECFRCLRQSCALNSEIQGHLKSSTSLLRSTRTVMEKLLASNPDSDQENLLKSATQFLGNACAANTDNQNLVWNMFLHLFKPLLLHPDTKLCDYICMVVHTCLTAMGRDDQALLTSEVTQDIVLACIQATAQRDIEWGLYVLEDMLKNDLFLQKLFSRLGEKERLLLLEVILAEMNELPACAQSPAQSRNQNGDHGDADGPEGSGGPRDSGVALAVSPGNLQFISDYVKRECDLLLEIDKSEVTGQEEALVIAKELEALSVAAQHMDLYPSIQEDADLLRCCVSLLRSITEQGKAEDSVYKREEKALARDSVDPHHPVYGLKKDLIRLIANMCYKHRRNQDLVRTLDGIPLLLDLTMIDTRNPFITQWVVLAIRNLLEDNRENRDVLSGMSLQGMAGHMAALREMGVHTELRGGKIVVKPVDK